MNIWMLFLACSILFSQFSQSFSWFEKFRGNKVKSESNAKKLAKTVTNVPVGKEDLAIEFRANDTSIDEIDDDNDTFNYCSMYTEDSNIFNEQFNAEAYYVNQPLIESKLLRYTLQKRLILWSIFILGTKPLHNRLALIDIHDKKLLQNKENRFDAKLTNLLENRYPRTYILLNALSKSFQYFDALTLKKNLEESITDKRELFHLEILIDSSYEERQILQKKFLDLGGKIDLEKLMDMKYRDPLKELLVKLLNGPNNQILTINKAIYDESEKLVCLFKSTTACSNSITNKPEKKAYLNDLYGKYDLRTLKAIQEKFYNSAFKNISSSCKSVLEAKYCDGIELIENYINDRITYFAKRLYYLIQNQHAGSNIPRILLRALHRNELDKIKNKFYELYRVNITERVQSLSSKQNLNKDTWKFWKKRALVSDRNMYIRGVRLLLDDEEWCFSNCDITLESIVEQKSTKKTKTSNNLKLKSNINLFG